VNAGRLYDHADIPQGARKKEDAQQIAKGAYPMLLLIILLVLLFGGGGGYYGFSRWGAGGGFGILGTVLLIVLVVYLLGGIR
jgi:hypothetical protein